MNIALFDASAAGSLANASLCARDKPELPEAQPFAAEQSRCAQAAAAAPCKSRLRRAAGALFSLISGPTFESTRNGANNI